MTTRNCGFYSDFFSGLPASGPSLSDHSLPCQAWPPHLSSIVEMARAGRFAQADAALALCSACPVDSPNVVDTIRRLFLAAHLRLCQGACGEGVEVLRRAFALGREHGVEASAVSQPADLLASLCAVALEEAIEPVYVNRLIKQAGIAAPSPALVRWPYRLRFYSLGRCCCCIACSPGAAVRCR